MQSDPKFDQTSFLSFLEANKNKDIEAIANYLHQDCVFTFNKHVFNRENYLWFLKVTFPLIDFEFSVKNLIILEKSITCELMMDVRVLQNSHHFLVGEMLENQYWKGTIRATYALKEGEILAIKLEAEHIHPVSLLHRS